MKACVSILQQNWKDSLSSLSQAKLAPHPPEMVEVSQSLSCPWASLSQDLCPGWRKGEKAWGGGGRNCSGEYSHFFRRNGMTLTFSPLPSELPEPAPLRFSPLSSVIIAWLVQTTAQLATRWLCFLTDRTCALEDFSNKNVNIHRRSSLFESHPPSGSLLTSFVMSLATDFWAAQFDPFWIVLPWMNSCLKADLKWVLLRGRAVGWKECSLEQQRWLRKAGRLSWGWFCRCALV